MLAREALGARRQRGFSGAIRKMFQGASLTNITQGIFNSVYLVDETGENVNEVRDLFLTGSVKQSIPATPQTTDVLSIPGLIPQLQAKRDVSQSYSRVEIDNFIATNPGPTGPAGVNGTNGSDGPTGPQGAPGTNGTKKATFEPHKKLVLGPAN